MNYLKRLLIVVLIGGGLLLTLVPTILPLISRQKNADQIRSIHQQSEELDLSIRDQQIAQALEWNAQLAQNTQGLSGIDERDEAYQNQLRFFDDGVMGIVRIPSIDVSLPIYHGCSDEVLQTGAGHLPSSSLPIGSPTGRSVIAAHGGSVHATLFSRLDELRQGNTFEIVNPQGTLYYQVESLQVIEPDEIEMLRIEEGRDLVTLMTCTPYGINTHRLLVTGSRIHPTPEIVAQSQTQPLELSQWPSFRQILFSLWPFGLGLVVAIVLILTMNNRKQKKQNPPLGFAVSDWTKDAEHRRVDFGYYAVKNEPMNLSRKEKRLRKKKYRARFE